MLGNQLHSFNRRCHDQTCQLSQNTNIIKLVIQVEKGKVWLPKGMKVTNFPKVDISQPIDSLPVHLKHVLTEGVTGSKRTRSSSNSGQIP